MLVGVSTIFLVLIGVNASQVERRLSHRTCQPSWAGMRHAPSPPIVSNDAMQTKAS